MQHERMLVLEGGRNFRDMGGYPTTDGRQTRWRRLYRSGTLSGLTDADFELISGLGLKTLFDLRDTSERSKGETQWSRVPGLSYWARDYAQSLGALYAIMSSDASTVAEAMQVMVDIYKELPVEQAPSYRELFRKLADGELPLVFNCSGGKDRTGLGAVLVLTALGVEDAAVREDYALSNQALLQRAPNKEHSQTQLKMSPEVAQLLGGTHPGYLEAAFGSIDERFGSFQRYLKEELGVTDEMLREMQAHLLE